MSTKKTARIRRAKRARFKMRELGVDRLCVFRTSQHIYAQVISGNGATIIASASTVEADMRSGYGGNAEAAAVIGAKIAERAAAKGVSKVAFDRSGFKYHGRIKALAEAARGNGLDF
ncbi:MAG: 50S ribosomal protein L18 [Pseudomonadales bacterium]|nr:50S ribosomal protein L18 [Pseudomonadales bacterium]